MNVTWLVSRTHSKGVNFSIDRSSKSCCTPRRNEDIAQALGFYLKVFHWCWDVRNYFFNDLFSAKDNSNLDLSAINSNEMFVPILTLFENVPGRESRVVLTDDLGAFIEEQRRSLAVKMETLSKVFKDDAAMVSKQEALCISTLLHLRQIGQQFSDSVDYIEDMLRSQLIAAIGKIITATDFGNYMRYHNRKLFKKEFEPKPFSYAIRRPDHSPEGEISIESVVSADQLPEPILTTVSASAALRPMRIALNAATKISFWGERFVHAWVDNQFSDYKGSRLQLIARARQFSSFILLVGKIASADVFDAKYGIIIQNKDDLKIPLILETIPTPKEFQDAIESLSPEQQRFCKAYRGMQLAGTLFAVAVIQIKPQMEKLLNLPEDSLTKEIKLTQDLSKLFIEYQIPSDLLSYAGWPEASVQVKLMTVQLYVQNMFEMINASKEEEVQEAQMQAAYVQPLAVPIPPPRAQLMMMEIAAMPMQMQMQMMETSAMPMQMMLSAPAPAAPAPAAPAPAPSPAPEVSAPEPSAPEEQIKGNVESTDNGVQDYTKLPGLLDSKFAKLDEDAALRATTIDVGKEWNKKFQKALLAKAESETLSKEAHRKEKNKAFDLLDALTKSGCLDIEQASLHVVLASTHCFDETLMNTVIQKNVNPIEKVERSSLIVATTIHNRSARELVQEDQVERVSTYSPMLFQ